MEPTKRQRFEELLGANIRRFAAIARSYADGDDWRDLLQEIQLQVWRSLDGFKGRSAVETWAYRVALNTAIVWGRRSRIRRADTHDTIQLDKQMTGNADGGNEATILTEFVGSLGPAERGLFLLYLEDLSYREIADITGLTESNVGVKIHRLKRVFVERYIR